VNDNINNASDENYVDGVQGEDESAKQQDAVNEALQEKRDEEQDGNKDKIENADQNADTNGDGEVSLDEAMNFNPNAN
jgi:hypothetical protein